VPIYKIKAPAKINLFLDVLRKLPNGYHELDTVMQSVSLCDTVTINTEADGLSVKCSEEWLSGSENLAYKAAVLFCEAANVKPDYSIYIDKKIPIAAGLAGGSTDAAAVLYLLNEINGRPLDTKALYALALKLGADVTFCVYGGTMRAGGIGEHLTPCPIMPDCRLLMVISKSKVSSGEAYAKLDAEGFSPRENGVISALESNDLSALGSSLFNIFERIAPEIEATKRILLDCGAKGALMSGSGPTVFGLFDSEAALDAAMKAVKAAGLEYAVCEPICGRK